MKPTDPDTDRLLVRPAEAARRLAFGTTKIRQLIRSGQLRAVRVDGVLRVPVAALDRFVAELPPAAPSAARDGSHNEETRSNV